MKILLINPPFLPKFSRSSRSPAVTKSSTIYYPIWLAHAAGLLEKRNHTVMLIDFPAEGKMLHQYRKQIIEFSPGIVVCDTSTPSIEADVGTLESVKKWFVKQPLGVLVGTHPSALPDQTFNLSRAIDVIALGEYDYTLCEIAERSDMLQEVAGICFRKNGKIIHNEPRSYAENLDEIPFVSSVIKKHLNIFNYFYAHCRNPVISIFAGRGCPNRCYFCVYPQVMFGRRYRHRSVCHFVDELEYIKREFPQIREVLVDDDNFTADQEYVSEICDEIIRRNLLITWTCEVRVNIQYDIMVKMKAAGCRLLVAGFESGNQQVLDAICKGTTLSQGEEFVRNAKKAGLRVHGCFMIGNRNESPETLEQTLCFAMKLNLDTAQFFPLIVYPGTEAYQWAESCGYIQAKNFRQWLTADGMHNCVLHTNVFSGNDLVDFCDHARRQFYLRPRYIAYKGLDVLRNPSEISRTVKAATTFLNHIFKRHR